MVDRLLCIEAVPPVAVPLADSTVSMVPVEVLDVESVVVVVVVVADVVLVVGVVV